MKLTSFMLLFFGLHLSGRSVSQTVTLSGTHLKLETVLTTIEKQTGFISLYDRGDMANALPVSVAANRRSLRDFLDTVFKYQPLTYTIRKTTIFIKPKPSGNTQPVSPASLSDTVQLPITGKVTDENGQPLIGVSIRVKGTSAGTVTNTDGGYTIRANAPTTLLFSYIGYVPQEAGVSKSGELDIILKQLPAALEEAVVVGYGTQKKANLTGAVDRIGGEVLRNRPVPRLSQALQGQIGNLNVVTSTEGGAPGAKQNLNVRGFTGLGNMAPPLVVIDGIPGGDINTINPNDVEDISVLKDAASSAIYGATGAYGVILITTKQGKRNQRARVSYNNNISFAQAINVPRMMNSLDFANLYNEAFLNAGRSQWFDNETIGRIKDYQSGKLKDETVLTPDGFAWMQWNAANANNDWFNIYLKDLSNSQQHNIDVRGGSDKITYYLGAGLNARNGMFNYADEKYRQYNLRANINGDVTSWMKFAFRSSFNRENNDVPFFYGNSGIWMMEQIARRFPTVPLRNPDGNYSYDSFVPFFEQGGRNKNTRDNLSLTGELIVNPLKGWDITANYTLTTTGFNDERQGKTFYLPLPKDGELRGGQYPDEVNRTFSAANTHVINFFSSYEKQLSDHYVKVMGGYIRQEYNYKELYGKNSFTYSQNLPSLALTYFPQPVVSDVLNDFGLEGFFGRINYNYKQKLLLELNGRYDATSRFLSNDRWAFFPGISAGYVPSKEDFWKGIEKTVNYLKFRGSYAALGDQESFLEWTPPYYYYPFYPALRTTTPPNTNWLFGSGDKQAAVTSPEKLVPNNLTWQKPVSLNLGVDMAFLDWRLNANLDYFVRTVNDLVGPAKSLPGVLGIAAPRENNSRMQTRGFELTLEWKDKIGKLQYQVRGVLSDYKGKILKYPNKTGILSDWYEGQQLGDIWGYRTIGLFKDDAEVANAPSQSFLYGNWGAGDVHYADLNGDKKIDRGDYTRANPGDLAIIGNESPRYAYSLTLSLQYAGFDFSTFLQGVAKRDAWVSSNYFWGIIGHEWNSSPFTVHQDRWTQDNPGGYFPKFYMNEQNDKNTQVQTRYLQNAAYMRIKNMQLGYTLPKTILQRLDFEKLRVYVSIDNLATFTKQIRTMDPELSIGNGRLYPLQRTFSFGINASL
ncbi:TonB-dependent receptor [Chitinophaga defluvii]|uniref:TonB-dependent receptor n=1 Tax=Chitinophaga defluvii TaxID=3163343 RepID=A0ABV2SZ75_9BACT